MFVFGAFHRNKGIRAMTRAVINAEAAGKPVGPYSQAVAIDDWIFVSAEKGVDPATGKIVEGGAGPETAQALKNIRTILEAAGSSLADVVRCVVFLRNMEKFAEMNQVYATFFPDNPPARTTVGVSALPLGLEVLIEVTACKTSAKGK
jgi:2-iminobutanoate/2-iminopropanoate deaminase